LGCESAGRLLLSTSTINIYYHSSWKLIIILPSHWRWKKAELTYALQLGYGMGLVSRLYIAVAVVRNITAPLWDLNLGLLTPYFHSGVNNNNLCMNGSNVVDIMDILKWIVWTCCTVFLQGFAHDLELKKYGSVVGFDCLWLCFEIPKCKHVANQHTFEGFHA